MERGYLLVPVALQSFDEGDAATAYATFGQAAEIGDRFGDPDLVALRPARPGPGADPARARSPRAWRCSTRPWSPSRPARCLRSSPGSSTARVIEACQEIFDLRRAQEWTAALSRWCASQPDLVPYRGQCLVHRAEIMQLHGAWPDAMDEAQRACERLSEPPGQPAVGAAFYQQAELHRLRGEFAEGRGGLPPGQPVGTAAAARPGAAAAGPGSGRRRGGGDPPRRGRGAGPRRRGPRLLAAYVEIMLAAGDVAAARAAADELSRSPPSSTRRSCAPSPPTRPGPSCSPRATPAAALAALRRAWTAWQELEAPYEAARVRVLIGLACRAARRRGHRGDGARRGALGLPSSSAPRPTSPGWRRSRGGGAQAAGGLTAREVEVLRLVAPGKTNRAIAAELFISEKTVARHVSNIFTKLGLSSRAAATAYAYEHDLV